MQERVRTGQMIGDRACFGGHFGDVLAKHPMRLLTRVERPVLTAHQRFGQHDWIVHILDH
jgi:hypothetical protein